MTLTVTDLFCGAGGSSQGLTEIAGVELRLAANHWDLAVQSHAVNFPDADHDIANISQVDFRRYPATDLLWASPECTNHSQAKGLPKRLQSQPDLFDEVLPDEAALRSRATMFDVPRALEVGRLRGRPYKGFIVENVVEVRDWLYWPAWWTAVTDCAGYCCHFVSLNSMFAMAGGAPAPQSRNRAYIVGHLKETPCPDLDKWTSPLAWCPDCREVVYARQTWKNGRTAGSYRSQYYYRCPNTGSHLAAARQVHGVGAQAEIRRLRMAAVEPMYLPAAAAIDWSMPGQRIGDRKTPLADKTMARIEAGLAKYLRPITLEAAGHTFERRPGVRTWPADQVLTTLHTTASKALAYAAGMLVPAGGTWNDDATPLHEPMRSRTTREAEALLVPVEGRDGVFARPAGEPMRTQTARHQDALLVPFIAELRGGGSNARAVTEALATVCASGNHHGLVMRNNTPRGDAAQMCTPTGEPLRTLTTAGHQSLITWAQYAYDTGQLAPVDVPLPTQTTVEGDALLGATPDVMDCLFRMLEPHEIGAGMAFGVDYEVLGNRRERVKQYGNAVTPPAARDLGYALVEAITGETFERVM
jgi:DNA (cytosine-5)-methyltransferase 1